MQRKTLCDPIIDADANAEFSCQYCGRAFSSRMSKYRHIRQSCQVANTDDGFALLADRTIQRQLAEQAAQIAAQAQQIAALAEQVNAAPHVTVNNLNIANDNGTVAAMTGGVIGGGNAVGGAPAAPRPMVRPWGSDLNVTAADIDRIFAESRALTQYARMAPHIQVDRGHIGYAVEALMSVVRRAHEDPVGRNVYINPRRSDQVLVLMATGAWAVRTLEDATAALCDGAAVAVNAIVLKHTGNPTLVECTVAGAVAGAAAANIPRLYWSDRDGCVRLARRPMEAHLANTAPEPGHGVLPAAPSAFLSSTPSSSLSSTSSSTSSSSSSSTSSSLLSSAAPAALPQAAASPDSERLTSGDAAAMLVRHPRGEREQVAAYVWRLSARSGKAAYRIVAKLWEALENGEVVGDGAVADARAAVAANLADPAQFD